MDLNEVPPHGYVRHPWEQVRLDFFHRLLVEHGDLASARAILDVGAGDGWFARELLGRLPPTASIACFDAAYDRAGLPRGGARLSFSSTAPEGRFDVLLFMDVLEHVESDRAFLREIVERNARAGSRVLLSVPAWPTLRSSHDTMLLHYRRYSPAQLIALADSAGLRPIRRGELFTSLLAPRAASILRERLLGPNGGTPRLPWPHSAAAARVVRAALALDARFCRAASAAGWRVPGLSTWVLCERD